MGIFDKLAKELSGRKTTSVHLSDADYNVSKSVTWQCRYCGRRHTTYGSVPSAGVCDARGRVNGFSKPHDWRKY